MNKIFTRLFLFALLCLSSSAFATTHTVTVNASSFSPASFNCNVGDTVNWVLGSGTHTTTSTSVPSGAATWDSPINSTTTSFSYTVTVSGSYNYVCTPHGFTGTFTAGAAPVGNVFTVQVGAMGFNPDTITCNVGDSVKWVHQTYVHTTTSTMVPIGAAVWDAPIANATPTYSYVITVPGSYNYKCTPHNFTGTLTATPVLPTVHTVTVNFSNFSPSNFNCNIGDTIRWVLGGGTHTTTSTSVPGGAATWDAPITSGNPTFDYIVTVAGTYNYKCTPHGFTGTFTASAGTVSTHTVTVEMSAFNPSTVNCVIGDTIRWVLANENHTTTSLTVPAGAAPWNSPITAASPTFTYPVTTAGLYTYKSTGESFNGVIIAIPLGGIHENDITRMNIYPNPVKDQFIISYELKENEKMQVELFDINGRLVQELISGMQSAGKHTEHFSFQHSLSPGLYILKSTTSQSTNYSKIVVY